MAKLTIDQMIAELAVKNFTLVSAANYEHLQSPIVIRCENKHLIETTMGDFRLPSFECPLCHKSIVFTPTREVPPKNGHRIIAFDQATERFGLSLYDQGELKFYSLYTFSGEVNIRIDKIKQLIEKIVIKEWKPDKIIMEDIQLQRNNVVTYKILAMLLGVLINTCIEHNIPYEVVSSSVWRKIVGTHGKTRVEEKQNSRQKVFDKFGIWVNDDIAEAILIGLYGVKTYKPPMKFF